jgi:hypothetical protein
LSLLRVAAHDKGLVKLKDDTSTGLPRFANLVIVRLAMQSSYCFTMSDNLALYAGVTMQKNLVFKALNCRTEGIVLF